MRFLQIESASGLLLLFFALAAFMLSNSPWAQAFELAWNTQVGLQVGTLEFTRSFREWINDGLMTLFFFVVALELKRQLVFGALNTPRMAALSISAALGGMIIPALIYLVMQSGEPGENGWGTVMATDTAFVIGCLALLGTRIPKSLRVFMLSLAIIDDIGAILVVAIGYSSHIVWWPLMAATLGLMIIRAMAKLGFRSFSLFFLMGGLIWLAVDASGIHATVTGVILGLMTPARRWVAETAARETLSPVERLEFILHPWVGFFIMPLFAFANAGLPIVINDLDYSVALAVIASFVLGKPLGILLFSWLTERLHIGTRPPGLSWRLLTGGSLLAGIGFTMSLFIADMAFSESLIGSAKLGIFLASI
ncbi:hypothetical protein CAPTEDRAFT_143555, partial [Capitella teleta]